MIGVTRLQDLCNSTGGTIAALDLEQSLVTMGVEGFAGRRLNFLDPVLGERILERPSGRGDPAQ